MRPLGRRSFGRIVSLVWMDWKGLESWEGSGGLAWNGSTSSDR